MTDTSIKLIRYHVIVISKIYGNKNILWILEVNKFYSVHSVIIFRTYLFVLLQMSIVFACIEHANNTVPQLGKIWALKFLTHFLQRTKTYYNPALTNNDSYHGDDQKVKVDDSAELLREVLGQEPEQWVFRGFDLVVFLPAAFHDCAHLDRSRLRYWRYLVALMMEHSC